MEEQEVHTPETTESHTLNPDEDREIEAKSDGWDDALNAFNEPEGEVNEKQEVKPEEPKSHIEQGKQDTLNLDDLKVPQKYKGAVKERIEKVTSEYQKQVQAKTQEAATAIESAKGLIDVFKECVANPSKIPEYVVNYGSQLGIDENVIRQYAGLYSGDQTPQSVQVPQEQNQQNTMDSIFNKYVEKMVSTQDPQEFVGTLKSVISDTINLNTQQMMGAVKDILMGYHNEIVNPNLQTIEEAKQQAVSHAQVSAWNEAFQSLKSNYPDVEKYAPDMKRLLKEDEEYSALRSKLNKTPHDVAKHQRLLERLYRDLSYNDKREADKAPKPKFTGVAPSSKYISTTKAGGSDWDAIEKEFWS